jgi:hypothetical protein
MWFFNFQLFFLKPRLPFMERAKAKFIQVLSSHNILARYGTQNGLWQFWLLNKNPKDGT